ncbi:MAG: PEP-CTERM sorting domain-containing protein [Opitutaceae bacterium]|jgi:hypothetical protein|nr:PEP-CTERM sorting domain-containing protein [Opitutaceae bacterium]
MKPRIFIPAITSIAVAVLVTASLSAQSVLVTYGLDSNNKNGVATNIATTITATAMSASADGAAAGNFGFSSSNGHAFSRLAPSNGSSSAILATSLDNALAGNRYFEFTLTPRTGETISIGTVSFNMLTQDIDGSKNAVFAANYALVATVGGTTYTVGTSTMTNQPNGVTQGGPATFDLSSVAGFDFKAVDSAVTFKIFLYTDADVVLDYNQAIRLTNLVVSTAAPAVPEPAHAALLLAGGVIALVILVRRRCFHRAG